MLYQKIMFKSCFEETVSSERNIINKKRMASKVKIAITFLINVYAKEQS